MNACKPAMSSTVRAVFVGILIWAVCSTMAWASTLDDNASTVRQPAKVILISVAKAGGRLVAVGVHGVIIISDDNGRTWRQSAVQTSETITCVAFATPRDGWAAGGQGVVLHTVDGGATWLRQITEAQVLPLMQAAAAGAAAADPQSTQAMRAVRRAGIFAQAGLDKPFLAILPFNPQSALVFGAYRMTILTHDAGKTWQDWSLHVGDPISHNIYDVTKLGGYVFLAGEAGTLLRANTLDQGVALDFDMVTSPTDGTLLGILGTKNNTLLTFGVAGNVFRSTDAGQTWTQSNIAAGSDITAGVLLASGEVVVISEDGRVFGSTDDGVSFHQLPLTDDMALFGLAQADNGDVIFVGSGGVRVVPKAAFD